MTPKRDTRKDLGIVVPRSPNFSGKVAGTSGM